MDRQYYLWTAGGSTVSVAFSPTFMKRLKQAAETSDHTEVGGILLGLQQSTDEITVEDFELLPSEHRRGATFTLSQADRKKLGQRLRARHQGLEPVGSFRTHVRQGLYMDQYDFDLMSSHFAGPNDIMLLVRPTDWTAGVFVWEEGDIHRQKSYGEFPFDPAALQLTGIALDPVSPSSQPNTPAAQAVIKSKAAVTAAPRKRNSAWSGTVMPTLAKVAVVAATFGLVAVLAHFAHEHHAPATTAAAAQVLPISLPVDPPATGTVNPPVDPALPNSDLSEMHVKLAPPDKRPTALGQPVNRPDPNSTPALSTSASNRPTFDAQSATPPTTLPPLQTAMNLPPEIAPMMLRPTPPTLVSVVSLQPSEPGLVSRSINRIPVINLLQRHKYKAGENFVAAKPVRQVKPKLPADLELDDSSPTVDVKVWIDKSGQVTKAELLSDQAQPEVADIASNAALKWTFEPARVSDHAVSSEMVMHFRFAPKQATESYSALRRPLQHP
jgi:TonB family protein